MVATAMDSYKKDEMNISIKINSYEYFNSAKIPMEFKIYHPITNNYLPRTSESIQRGRSFMLSANLERIDRIQATYLTFINFFNNYNKNKTLTTPSSVQAARDTMSAI